MGHKRTKKDVEDAYRRGFQDGFNVRPNPLAMILRALWKKHERKKMEREWKKHRPFRAEPIGFVKSFTEDEHGISAEIVLEDKRG